MAYLIFNTINTCLLFLISLLGLWGIFQNPFFIPYLVISIPFLYSLIKFVFVRKVKNNKYFIISSVITIISAWPIYTVLADLNKGYSNVSGGDWERAYSNMFMILVSFISIIVSFVIFRIGCRKSKSAIVDAKSPQNLKAVMAILTGIFLIVLGAFYFAAHPINIGNPISQTNNPIPAGSNIFTYNGQPINPLCVSDLVQVNQTVSLSTCSANYSKYSFASDPTTGVVKSGSHGDLTETRVFNEADYRVLSSNDNHFVLAELTYGGGAHSYLVLPQIRRDGDILTLEKNVSSQANTNFECRGLIRSDDPSGSGFKSDAKNVYFSERLGSAGLLNLVPGNAYDGSDNSKDFVPDSYGICPGTANYDYTVLDSKKYLISVKLGDRISAADEQSGAGNYGKAYSGYKYQLCFDKVYNEAIDAGITLLTGPAQLQRFSALFENACVGK